MAQKKQIALRKDDLITQLANSRESINHGRATLKQHLQVKNQLRRLTLNRPKATFGGAAIAGLATALILRRPRKLKRSKKSAKASGGILLAWVLALLKPAARAWFITRAKDIAATQITSRNNTYRQLPPPEDT